MSAPLPQQLRDQLRDHLERVGEVELVATLQISRHALYRCLAGLGVYRGTRALIREGKPSKAANQLRRALEIEPANRQFQEMLDRALSSAGSPSEIGIEQSNTP